MDFSLTWVYKSQMWTHSSPQHPTPIPHQFSHILIWVISLSLIPLKPSIQLTHFQTLNSSFLLSLSHTIWISPQIHTTNTTSTQKIKQHQTHSRSSSREEHPQSPLQSCFISSQSWGILEGNTILFHVSSWLNPSKVEKGKIFLVSSWLNPSKVEKGKIFTCMNISLSFSSCISLLKSKNVVAWSSTEAEYGAIMICMLQLEGSAGISSRWS